MDSWGCEFVEDNGPTIDPIFTTDDIIMIDMVMLDEIVDKAYLKEIRVKDKERIQSLTADIARRGILNPGKLVYDNQTVRLQDGNHRYLAAKSLEYREFPVLLVRANNIRAAGAPLEFAFRFLMTNNFPAH